MEPIGYVYSDGSELCPEDAARRGFEDENNETGEAGALFSITPAHRNITCDECGGLIKAQNFVDE